MKRHGRMEHASDAIARQLRDLGLTVPEHLREMVDAEPPSRPRSPDDMRDRSSVMRGFGWPKRALQFAEDADVDRPAIVAIEAWDPNRCAIVLAGPKGTGKTVAAAWWAFGSSRVFRFVRAAELVRVGRFDEGWTDWLKASALCIDDLGAEYADQKGSFVSDLDLLIDTFYADCRPLIITTNCGGAKFAERYGPRIADRITECATWAQISGDSMRGRT